MSNYNYDIKEGHTIENRFFIQGAFQPNELIYFSKIDGSGEFPKTKKIWVGHPAIARFIVKCLKWWNS